METLLLSFALVLARAGTFVTMLPFFGGPLVPRTVRVGLGLALAVFWFTALGPLPPEALEGAGWLAISVAAGREVVLGGMLGVTFGLFLVPFRVAGEFVGQEMGLTLATITDPTRVQSGTVMGQAFELIGVLLLLALEVHHVFLAALHGSFAHRPIGGDVLPVPAGPYVAAVGSAQEWGLLITAPITCCLFITSLILALMARAAPQLNIMSIGFVLRLGVGLVATFMFLPEIASAMRTVLERFSEILYGISHH